MSDPNIPSLEPVDGGSSGTPPPEFGTPQYTEWFYNDPSSPGYNPTPSVQTDLEVNPSGQVVVTEYDESGFPQSEVTGTVTQVVEAPIGTPINAPTETPIEARPSSIDTTLGLKPEASTAPIITSGMSPEQYELYLRNLAYSQPTEQTPTSQVTSQPIVQKLTEKELFENQQRVLHGDNWKERLQEKYGDSIKPEAIRGKDVDYLLKNGYINEAGVATEKGRAAGLPEVAAGQMGVTPQEMIGDRAWGLLVTEAQKAVRPEGTDPDTYIGVVNNRLNYEYDINKLALKGIVGEEAQNEYLRMNPWVTLQDYLSITNTYLSPQDRQSIIANLKLIEKTTPSLTMVEILAKQGKVAESQKAQKEYNALTAILDTLKKLTYGTVINPTIVYADTPFAKNAKLTKDDHGQPAIMWEYAGNKYGIAKNYIDSDKNPYRYYTNGRWDTKITECSDATCTMDNAVLTSAKNWVDSNGFSITEEEIKPKIEEPVKVDEEVIKQANERVKEELRKDFNDSLTTQNETDKKKLEEEFENNPLLAAILSGVADAKLEQIYNNYDINRVKDQLKESVYVGGGKLYSIKELEKLPQQQQDYIKSMGVDGLSTYISTQYKVLEPYTKVEKDGTVNIDVVEALRSLEPAKISAVYALYTPQQIEEQTKGRVIYAGNIVDQFKILQDNISNVFNNPDFETIKKNNDKLIQTIADNLQVIGERISNPVYLEKLVSTGAVPEWLKQPEGANNQWWLLNKDQQDALTNSGKYKETNDMLNAYKTNLGTVIQLMRKNAPDLTGTATYKFVNKDIKESLNESLKDAETKQLSQVQKEDIIKQYVIKDIDAEIEKYKKLDEEYKAQFGNRQYYSIVDQLETRKKYLDREDSITHEMVNKIWSWLGELSLSAKAIENPVLKGMAGLGLGVGTISVIPYILALQGVDISSHAGKSIFGKVSEREEQKTQAATESIMIPLGMLAWFASIPKEIKDDPVFSVPYTAAMLFGGKKLIEEAKKPVKLLEDIAKAQYTASALGVELNVGLGKFDPKKLTFESARRSMEGTQNLLQKFNQDASLIEKTGRRDITYIDPVSGASLRLAPSQKIRPSDVFSATSEGEVWKQQIKEAAQKGTNIEIKAANPQAPANALWFSQEPAWQFMERGNGKNPIMLSIITDTKRDYRNAPEDIQNALEWGDLAEANRLMREKIDRGEISNEDAYNIWKVQWLSKVPELEGTFFQGYKGLMPVPKELIPNHLKKEGWDTAVMSVRSPITIEGLVKEGDYIDVVYLMTKNAIEAGLKPPTKAEITASNLMSVVTDMRKSLPWNREKRRQADESETTYTSQPSSFKAVDIFSTKKQSVLDTYQNPDGTIGYIRPASPRSALKTTKTKVDEAPVREGIEVILINDKGEIVLGNTLSEPKYWASNIGGAIDPFSYGKTFKDSVAASIRTEAGIEVNPQSIHELGIYAGMRKNHTYPGSRVYLAYVGDKTPNPIKGTDPTMPPEMRWTGLLGKDVVKITDRDGKQTVESVRDIKFYPAFADTIKAALYKYKELYPNNIQPQLNINAIKVAKPNKSVYGGDISDLLKYRDETFSDRVIDGTMIDETTLREIALARKSGRLAVAKSILPPEANIAIMDLIDSISIKVGNKGTYEILGKVRDVINDVIKSEKGSIEPSIFINKIKEKAEAIKRGIERVPETEVKEVPFDTKEISGDKFIKEWNKQNKDIKLSVDTTGVVNIDKIPVDIKQDVIWDLVNLADKYGKELRKSVDLKNPEILDTFGFTKGYGFRLPRVKYEEVVKLESPQVKSDTLSITEQFIKDIDNQKLKNYTPEQVASILDANGIKLVPENMTIGNIRDVLQMVLDGKDILNPNGSIHFSYIDNKPRAGVLGYIAKDNAFNKALENIKGKGSELIKEIKTEVTEIIPERIAAEIERIPAKIKGEYGKPSEYVVGEWTLLKEGETVPEGALMRFIDWADRRDTYYTTEITPNFVSNIKEKWVENRIPDSDQIITSNDMIHYYDAKTDKYYSASANMELSILLSKSGERIKEIIPDWDKKVIEIDQSLNKGFKKETPKEYIGEKEVDRILKSEDIIDINKPASLILEELRTLDERLMAKDEKGNYVMPEEKAAPLFDIYSKLRDTYYEKVVKNETTIKEQLEILKDTKRNLEFAKEIGKKYKDEKLAERTNSIGVVDYWIRKLESELKRFEVERLKNEKYFKNGRYDSVGYKPKYEKEKTIPRYTAINPKYEKIITITTKEYTPVMPKENQVKMYAPKYTTTVEKPIEAYPDKYETPYTKAPTYSPPYTPPYTPPKPYSPTKIITPPEKPLPIPTPRVTPTIILLRDGKEIKLTPKQAEGIVAWKQGIMYKLIYPPYGQKDIYNSPYPIKEVEYADGIRSATQSMVARYGKIPKEIRRRMGVVDIRIFAEDKGSDAKPRPVFIEKYQTSKKTRHKAKHKASRREKPMDYGQLLGGY